MQSRKAVQQRPSLNCFNCRFNCRSCLPEATKCEIMSDVLFHIHSHPGKETCLPPHPPPPTPHSAGSLCCRGWAPLRFLAGGKNNYSSTKKNKCSSSSNRHFNRCGLHFAVAFPWCRRPLQTDALAFLLFFMSSTNRFRI